MLYRNRQRNKPPTGSLYKQKLRNDLLFIGGLLLFAALLGLALLLFRGEGAAVTVEVDGVLMGTYPLDVDNSVEIRTGEHREEVNLLVIRGGEAFVESATCPDGICAAHRPISREGESIVCLPHRVVITVVGDGKDVSPDVVA